MTQNHLEKTWGNAGVIATWEIPVNTILFNRDKATKAIRSAQEKLLESLELVKTSTTIGLEAVKDIQNDLEILHDVYSDELVNDNLPSTPERNQEFSNISFSMTGVKEKSFSLEQLALQKIDKETKFYIYNYNNWVIKQKSGKITAMIINSYLLGVWCFFLALPSTLDAKFRSKTIDELFAVSVAISFIIIMHSVRQNQQAQKLPMAGRAIYLQPD
jgi:hypothetical protein